MSICKYCRKEKLEGHSCLGIPVRHGSSKYEPVKYGDESNPNKSTEERCPDCGVIKGGYHHIMCEQEECPVCGGKLVNCGCME